MKSKIKNTKGKVVRSIPLNPRVIDVFCAHKNKETRNFLRSPLVQTLPDYYEATRCDDCGNVLSTPKKEYGRLKVSVPIGLG